MTNEEMTEALYSFDKSKYIDMLEHFGDALEDCVWVLKNPDQYDENEIYQLIENMRNYCQCISSDSRATGTLMKQLGI